MTDTDDRLALLEAGRKASSDQHSAHAAGLATANERLGELHELMLERMQEARVEREERKRTDARLFAELRRLGEKVDALETARVVEEKTDARIEALSTKRREALKGWIGIIGGLMAAGLSAWGLIKLFGHALGALLKAKP